MVGFVGWGAPYRLAIVERGRGQVDAFSNAFYKKILTKEMVGVMKPGAVVVDILADMGGIQLAFSICYCALLSPQVHMYMQILGLELFALPHLEISLRINEQGGYSWKVVGRKKRPLHVMTNVMTCRGLGIICTPAS